MTQLERTGLEALTKAIGARRAGRMADIYRDRILPTAEGIGYRLSARGRRSRRQLHEMRDRYRGERCFIIGNGPSLRETDLALIKDEKTFVLNRGYLLVDRIGRPPTFLVAVNQYVVEQFADELLAVPTMKFSSWRMRRSVPDRKDIVLVRRSRRFTFSEDVGLDGAWEGATVTFVAMQLAYHLGFNEVILVGVDHSFATSGPANQLVTATAADPNHFDPNYFGPGVKWQLPDLETSEIAYRLARKHFEATGRSVVDATVGGKLTVFPKLDYERAVQETRR
jgi:hypothetical protein